MTSSAPTTHSSLPMASVIVPSVSGWTHLERCLQGLENQTERANSEILVANRLGDDIARRVRGQFPDTRLIECAPETSIPAMRRKAVEISRGKYIFLTEDHCIPRPDWIKRLMEVIEQGYDAAGGSIANEAGMRWAGRVAFIFEYSGFVLPLEPRDTWALPGNNIAYRRDAIERARDAIAAETWEYFWHRSMEACGMKARMEPSVTMIHDLPIGAGQFMLQRYYYSRSFAAVRASTLSLPARALHLVATPVLPLLFLCRLGRNCMAKPSMRGEFLISLPLLAFYAFVAALGEAAGYLAGPGTSLGKVR